MNPTNHERSFEVELTAYALGELDGEGRSRIEAAIAVDPALSAEVEEIRATARLLEEELAAEAGPQLGEARRAEVRAAAAVRTEEGPRGALSSGARPSGAARDPRRSGWRSPWRWLGAGAGVLVAAAASLVLVVVSGREAVMVAEPAERVLQASQGATVRRSVTTGSGVRTPVADGYAETRPRPTEAEARRLMDYAPMTESRGVWEASARASGADFRAAVSAEATRGDGYTDAADSPFVTVDDAPLSTFSIDVDTASYANLRSMVQRGIRPPRASVRIEEMVNYFPYRLPPPTDGRPFAVHVDVTDAPWKTDHLLARVALKARVIPREQRPHANLVFLVDVSGSMSAANRLPLVKQSLELLLEELAPDDTVALVVYAGAAGLVLPPTRAAERGTISAAIQRLGAGGSTDGGSGITLAYDVAQRGFRKGATNRVIIATDGDFNVGVVSQAALQQLIVEKAKAGVFLTVLGYGRGNLQDATLEMLADKGNGNYGYIDRLEEAHKVLVEELGGTLHTVAKDVKIQLELNPARIGAYRLIGYENRRLADRDFNDDAKDAGEIGAGHAVTALYELVPVGAMKNGVDALRYRDPRPLSAAAASGELFTVKLRYKEPEGSTSQLIERNVHESQGHFAEGSEDLRFAAAVAAFGMVLRDSPHKGDATLDKVLGWARGAVGADPGGYRAELVGLVEAARQLR